MTLNSNLQEWFGGIDIYLFDQLLKGRLTPGMRLLDAGCGGGRNLVYFFRTGYDVCGVDESRPSIAQVRELAASLARNYRRTTFASKPLKKCPSPTLTSTW